MEYVKKICPTCGNEFFVLKTADKKAIYCTLECLTKVQKISWHQEVSIPAVQ
jgi:hypothetical protein